MNITFACPHCDRPSRVMLDAEARTLPCAACGKETRIPNGTMEGQRLTRCLVCPSTDLYVRKDFPQRLGVCIVLVGIVGSSIAWAYAMVNWTFGILFATAFFDLALYFFVGNALMCYRCDSQYRGFEDVERHGSFDLETHERYRQLAARTAK